MRKQMIHTMQHTTETMLGRTAGRCAMLVSLLAMFVSMTFVSCEIEPPLYLPAQDVRLERAALDLKVDAVWENPYWESEFLYGWTAADISNYGPVIYESPYDYAVRIYFKGEQPNGEHISFNPATMEEGNYFRSVFVYGYHDVLAFSNIYTPDNTQSVIISENLQSVHATVSRNSTTSAFSNVLAYHLGMTPSIIYNQPDIFFSAYLQDLHVTADPADYDYFDDVKKCWVKKVDMPSGPLVYIYLVQVVLRNNDGRITGINNGMALSGVTDYINVNTGFTSNRMSSVHMDMGALRKKVVDAGYLATHHSGFNSKCTLGETVDVVGGRLTTYGLCGMQGFLQNRSSHYSGQYPDNQNLLAIDFNFKNGIDSMVVVDVSSQMKRTCHGGVLTIELDAKDIPIPHNPTPPSGGSGFDPWIENYRDSIVHEFGM